MEVAALKEERIQKKGIPESYNDTNFKKVNNNF
jgi:hypothetical protein